MTTRRWLILVAMLGVLLGGGIAETRRREEYRKRFNFHAQQMEGSTNPNAGFFRQYPVDIQDRQIKAWIYHAVMIQKYKDALAIPFFYVEPDPN